MKNSLHISLWIGHYDDEMERGIWITLPVTGDKFSSALESVGIGDGDMVRWTYSTNVPGLDSYELADYPMAFVNHLAARLAEMEDADIAKLTAIMESEYAFDNVEQFLDFTYTADQYTLLPDMKCAMDFWNDFMKNSTFSELSQDITAYFEPREFGLTVAQTLEGVFTPLGYLMSQNDWNSYFMPREIPPHLDLWEFLAIEDAI